MNKYLIIPHIQVRNANAQPAWWLVSAPPITAYVGFAHALALHLGANTHAGVAIIHHDIQFLGEQIQNNPFLPHQFRAAGLIDKDDYATGSVMALSAQPTARCHLQVSLVIAFAERYAFDLTDVLSFLRGARLAGGSILKHGQISVIDPIDSKAIQAIGKSGHVLVERQDLMTLENPDRDWIDVIFRQTRYKKNTKVKPNDEDEKQKEELKDTIKAEESQAWIVPTCLGYAGISEIKTRQKSREELPHMYVEPLVGLVQYQSLYSAGQLHFWRYIHPKPDVFITSTHHKENQS